MQTETDTVVLRAHRLGKAFAIPGGELRLFADLDLDVFRGELLAVTGRSGVGKSTLLHILGGMQAPSEGCVTVGDEDLYGASERRRAALIGSRFGFVFQNHHLLPGFSALENVLLPAWIAGANRTRARDRARLLLGRFGLSGREDHLPSRLSGGECQRVSLARALVNSPSIVFADEPTGNLDLANADSVLTALAEMVREDGGSVVIVTHDPRVTQVAHRVLSLDSGRING